MEKIKENTVYIVKTKEEDIWFRQWTNEQGYKWRSGNSLLDLTYFDYEISTVGYIGYKISTKHRIIDCSLYLTDCSDIICVKDLMRKESKNMNWKDFCVDASTLEEALEKWKKGLTVSKEEENVPDYTVKIVGNKTVVTRKDGKVGEARCNPEDKFDVAEGIRIAIDRINVQDVDVTAEEYVMLQYLKGLKGYYIEVNDLSMLSGCKVIVFDEKDNQLFYIENLQDKFKSLKRGLKYRIDDLLE